MPQRGAYAEIAAILPSVHSVVQQASLLTTSHAEGRRLPNIGRVGAAVLSKDQPVEDSGQSFTSGIVASSSAKARSVNPSALQPIVSAWRPLPS